MKRLTALFLCACLLLTLSGCGRVEEATLTTFAMGSYVNQTVYGMPPYTQDIMAECAAEITRDESGISWRVPDGIVADINKAAGKRSVETGGNYYDVMELMVSLAEASGGAFDPTIGPVSQLWDFDRNPHLPEKEELERALELVDYHQMEVLSTDTVKGYQKKTVSLQKEGMALDLGAVGKGFACDSAVAYFENIQEQEERTPIKTLRAAVVAVGGSIGVFGNKPDGSPWVIAIRDPYGDDTMGNVSIDKGFVSTSGSYEKQFSENGKIYHHILDPRTGYPAESGLVSVTVWAPDSGALSDGLSTACFVLGLQDSLPLLEQFGAEGVFITEKDEVYVTDGLRDVYRQTSPNYVILDDVP